MSKNSKNFNLHKESKIKLRVLLQNCFEWIYENLEGNVKTQKRYLIERIIIYFMVNNGGTAVFNRPVEFIG